VESPPQSTPDPRFCGRCGVPLAPGEAQSHQCPSAPAGTAGFAAPAPAPAPAAPSLPQQPAARTSALAVRPTVPSAALSGLRARWEGRPREIPSVGAWIGGAFVRRIGPVAVGIAAAWFNAPLVVLMATIGAVLGAVAGIFSGSAFAEDMLWKIDMWTNWVLPLPVGIQELMPQAAWQLGGSGGALWGAVSVAFQLGWLAFWWPWSNLYNGDPAWPVMLLIGQVVSALIIGTLYTIWAIMWEPVRLRGIGARRMSRREARYIMPMVEEVAAAMGLRGLPRVLVTDSPESNAYAATRHIVIHRGLLAHLQYDPDALRGVIAHELAHWAFGDPVGSLMVKGVSLPLYLVYELAVKLDQQGSKGSKLLLWVLSPLLWGVQMCVRYMVAPVEAAAARRRELRADAVAMRAGYGPGLRIALEAFASSFDGKLDGWDDVVLRHHPHTELRLEALEEEGVEYGWGPAQAASGPVAVRRPAPTTQED
jgi:Zn-dependent protease with chaperone function